MLLYKYLDTRKEIYKSILENQYVRFTQLSALNDPFESFPNFKKFIKSVSVNVERELLKMYAPTPEQKFGIQLTSQSTAKKRAYETLNQLRNRYGIFCLSECCDDILMWSHYGGSHSGFVIGFDTSNQFFSDNKKSPGIRKVNYSKIRPVMPESDYFKYENQQVLDFADKLIFTKSEHWKYEQEWRLVNIVSEASKSMGDIHLFKFPKTMVKEVIFGYNAPNDFKKEVTDIVKIKYPQARILNALIDEEEFKLIIK